MEYKRKNKMFNHSIQFDNKVDVIIPVYHPDEKFDQLLIKLMKQTVMPNKIIILQTIDGKSSELDLGGLPDIKPEISIEIIPINKEDFDHGGTRRQGAFLSDSDIMLFMTQDAVPVDNFLIEQLILPFRDPKVGASYARQLANKDADVLEKMTRIFNYPSKSKVKSSKDMKKLGIKTFFCSNVCAAYRKESYDKMGGFVKKTIFNEDMIMTYALIQSGYKVAYVADAVVIHSHDYSYLQQLRRNFDLGVSHRQYKEIFSSIKSESEGIKMIFRLVDSLINRKEYLKIPDLIINSGLKFVGYKLGYYYHLLPKELVLLLSMNKSYWKEENSKYE